MGITSTQLAKLCGVSRATVDRVLNNRGRVSSSTKEKVQNAAKKYDYSPNFIAKSLSKGKTFCIGAALPSLKNPFFSSIIDSMTKTARHKNYATIVSLYEDDPDREYSSIKNLMERQVDGLIIFPTGNTQKTNSLLSTITVPVVTILNRLVGFSCISPDYMTGMYDAASYVIKKGYTNLVFLCPPLYDKDGSNTHALDNRLEGLNKAVDENKLKGISSVIITGDDYEAPLLENCLGNKARTAILCSSDLYALEVLRIFPKKGIMIPKDVGLIGFDGLDMLKYFEPLLTTVSLPIEMIGENAADHLIDMIKDGTSMVPTNIPHKITPGETII